MKRLTRLLLLPALAVARAAFADPVEPPDAGAAQPQQAKDLRAVHVTARGDAQIPKNTLDLDVAGSFGAATIRDTPAAITVITRAALDARQVRTLSELARGDAALGDNYAPLGYYQNIAIRGFPLDLATGYRLNGLSLVGEQEVALEDKQRVEILKGLAGLEAGVVAPGGIVNYVSKRPANVRSVTLGTDSHGSRYAALDLGGWLAPTLGVRVNAAHEAMHSWVEHTDGRRSFVSLAADWRPGADWSVQLDTDYQTSGQRSVSGYQLLGGTTLPPHPSRTRLLGFEPWQRPVGIDASNTVLRARYRIDEDWRLTLAASHSHSVIDDNVAFAYGCFYSPACADGSPGYFFAPNGDYDIYDYRSPDDTRQNDELRAVLTGHASTGTVDHDLTFGADAFRRTLDARPYVYDYVGTANIGQAAPPYFPPSPAQPGPLARTLTSWQRSAFALDRVHLGARWQLLAGGKLVRVHELAYDTDGAPLRDTRKAMALPQAAILWQPAAAWTGYASWSQSLSLGEQAPYWTTNGGVTLPPRVATQIEAGVKYAWRDALSVQAALYRLRQPYQFAQPDATPGAFTFVQQGREVHTGLELDANGQVGANLHVLASVNLIRARAAGTGSPAYEGHQVVNVPAVRTVLQLDYQVPAAPGVHLQAGWRHAGRNVATPDGRTRVPAYDVFDAGLRYVTGWRQHTLTWRLSVDNVFNRFYWRDTGSSGGDSYLFPGAPRLARLSLAMDF